MHPSTGNVPSKQSATPLLSLRQLLQKSRIYNGFPRAATLCRGREPVRGNGTAGMEAYITVQATPGATHRRILYDTEALATRYCASEY
jgi:hypothetical protein